MKRRDVLVALIGGPLLAVAGRAAWAEEPLALKWAQLVPPSVAPPPPVASNKTFYIGSQPPGGDGSPPPPPLAEGKYMSMKRRQPGAGAPPAVVQELNGKLVRIGGYVVPIDFTSTSIKEFLLVPYVGA